jgi:LysM repeat protein/uncharacterized protein YukE
MSILDDIHNLWSIVGEVWDCGDIAGNAGVLRAHATHWRQMQTELQSLSSDLHGSVTQHLTGGRDGNWNDAAGQGFQTVWGRTVKQIDDLAGEFGQVATQLDQFADQVNNFNDNFHTCLIVIGASLVVMAATTWIPGVDLITDGASVAADAEEVDQAWNLINMLKGILTFVRTNLLTRNFVFNLAKNFLINFAVNWGSRIIERGIMLGDPTEGWSQYDRNQLLLLTTLSTLPSAIIPITSLGQWAKLPQLAVGPGESLPWMAFARSSLLRVGQTEILANAYNLLNHMIIQGQGFDFNILRTVGVGSASTGVPTLVIIGGNALWFIYSGGTSGLPQGLTMPTLVGVNTVADVMIPGISPLVRNARGLVYVTAGGHLPPALINVVQKTTGMIGQLPTYVVRAGDTLTAIAQRQYGSAADYVYILKANHLSSLSDLHAGEKLVLPAVPSG